MRDNPGGGELDPAEGVRRPCKKNFRSVLSCIGNSTREGCNRGSEVGTVQSGWDGAGPVPQWKSKESAGERIVRKISSPKRVTNVPNLCNGRGQWALGRNMVKGECCSGLSERVCQFISRKSSPFRGMGVRRNLWRPNSRDTLQGMDQSKKMVRQRCSYAGYSTWGQARSYIWLPQALQDEFSFLFVLLM